MDRFTTEVITQTPNSQRAIYVAVHRDYAECFVWDECCDNAGGSKQQLQSGLSNKEATPQSGSQTVRQHQIAHHPTGSPKFSKSYLPKQVNKMELRIHQKGALRGEPSYFCNSLQHHPDPHDHSPSESKSGQPLKPPLSKEQLRWTALTLYHSIVSNAGSNNGRAV